MPNATAIAPIRTRPVAESLMLTKSTPASRSRRAASIVRSMRIDRGGSISTAMTNEPSASFRARPDGGVASPTLVVSRRGVRGAAAAAVSPPSVSPPSPSPGGGAATARASRSSATRASIAARIAPVCSGVVPQQPPMIRAPAETICGTMSPKYAGPAPGDADGGDAAAAAAPRTPRIETTNAGDATPPSGLARKLADGSFVIAVEIDPPRSIRIDRTIEAARLLREAGVDFVNISDSATGRVRMGAMAVAFGIQNQLNVECLVHLTTRDRNLMALEAELLGAHALGVRNILALTGDPPRVSDRPATTAVWDVDAIGLIEIISRLNKGEDGAGLSIGQAAGFTIACALDSTATDADKEWARLERKLAAGAHVIMTQPLYSEGQVESMLARARRVFGQGGFPVPVLLGVLPLHSARHAEFLHNEVPGITIPDEQRAAMRAAGERGGEVGLEMSMNLLAQSESHVTGTYIMPSFGRYELAAELVRRLRARQGAANNTSQ